MDADHGTRHYSVNQAGRELAFDIYNLSDQQVSGIVHVAIKPAAWTVSFGPDPAVVTLRPMSSQSLKLNVKPPSTGDAGARQAVDVKITGDFGGAGKPVVAFRVATP